MRGVAIIGSPISARRVARAESERLAAMVEVAVARRLIRADELAGAAEG